MKYPFFLIIFALRIWLKGKKEYQKLEILYDRDYLFQQVKQLIES